MPSLGVSSLDSGRRFVGGPFFCRKQVEEGAADGSLVQAARARLLFIGVTDPGESLAILAQCDRVMKLMAIKDLAFRAERMRRGETGASVAESEFALRKTRFEPK